MTLRFNPIVPHKRNVQILRFAQDDNDESLSS